MDNIKLAVIGSRTFTDRLRLFKILDQNKDKISYLVSGKADGADTFADDYAKKTGIPIINYYAVWRPGGVLDKGAGFRRNAKIIRECDEVLAFWDGVSKGTQNSIMLAEQAGKPVTIIYFDASTQPAPPQD